MDRNLQKKPLKHVLKDNIKTIILAPSEFLYRVYPLTKYLTNIATAGKLSIQQISSPTPLHIFLIALQARIIKLGEQLPSGLHHCGYQTSGSLPTNVEKYNEWDVS